MKNNPPLVKTLGMRLAVHSRPIAALVLVATSLAAAALSVRADIVVTNEGVSTGSTMPGSGTDFIFFDANNYSFGGPSNNNDVENGTQVYSDLTSFTIEGGLQGGSFGNDASITTPAGQSLQTGFIYGSGSSGAFALTPGGSVNSVYSANPLFNYNDFNVYLMISNTSGDLNDTTVSLDGRVDGVFNEYGNAFAVTDNSTTGDNAEYVEFNVQGLGSALAAHGGNADLVVSMEGNQNLGGVQSYIGAVSFQSIPEPLTYLLLLASAAGIFFLRRLQGLMQS